MPKPTRDLMRIFVEARFWQALGGRMVLLLVSVMVRGEIARRIWSPGRLCVIIVRIARSRVWLSCAGEPVVSVVSGKSSSSERWSF